MEEKMSFEFPILSINKEEYYLIENWIQKYRLIVADKKLYIFGAGIRGSMMLKLLEEAHIKVAGFCDNSLEKQGAFVKEYRIFSPVEVFSDSEENYILVSPENTVEIEKMLQDEGYVKGKNYFVIKSQLYTSYCDEFFRKDNIEYLMFGDCYFTDLDIDDLEDKSMGEMAIEKVGRDRLKILSIHGMCIPSFYHLMQMQIELGIKPKAVAFIVNIPFCNNIQTKLPQSQHAELLKRIQKEIHVSTGEFAQYVELAEKRSHNIDAGSFSARVSSKGKNDSHLEKLLTKTRYMYEFKADNESIVYLKKMIELLQKNDIKPIPFMPALNYHVGMEFYGEDFKNKYDAICENIKECIREYGIEILDMSYLLEKEYYTGERMTKFPNVKGRDKEISLLCNKIQE